MSTKSAANDRGAPRPARVLVVDDEPSLVDIFSQFLGYKYQVEGFTSSTLALEELRAQPADLLVSDLVMPGLNGLQLTSAAKDLHPKLKVVLVSGVNPRSWPAEGASGLDRVDAFLAKPMSLKSLDICCARLLCESERAGEDELPTA